MELKVGFPSGSAAVQGYLEEDDVACRFFRGHFKRLSDFRAKAEEVDGRFDREARARAAEAIIVPEGGDPARLQAFVDEGGYVVTTGQQPALFGGPLYCVLKALTAKKLAESLEASLGVPVLPVFWVASEDHDWAEANHADVIGIDNELHRIQVEAPDPDVSPPIHRIRIGETAQERVEAFLALLPDTDFSGEYAEWLREGFTADATLADGFHAVLQKLLGPLGIFFTDAANPALKRHSAELLASELERAEEVEAVLAATASELESAEFPLQVPILEGGVNLFLEGPAGRERLYRDGDGFRLRTSDQAVSMDDVLARQAEDPTVLSPNVLLRPVVESAVFPTLSYVGGPGEMAYFAQLADYFEAHGIRMPVIHPRYAVTPVETKIGKVLDKFGLGVEALQRPFHEVAGDIARDEVPGPVKEALGKLRGGIGKGAGELTQAVRSLDPTLKGTVQHMRGQLFSAIDDVEKKVVQALKRENEIALAQLEKAQVHLFPNGKPAERVQNPFYYLSRYGGSFLDSLCDRFDVNPS